MMWDGRRSVKTNGVCLVTSPMGIGEGQGLPTIPEYGLSSARKHPPRELGFGFGKLTRSSSCGLAACTFRRTTTPWTCRGLCLTISLHCLPVPCQSTFVQMSMRRLSGRTVAFVFIPLEKTAKVEHSLIPFLLRASTLWRQAPPN